MAKTNTIDAAELMEDFDLYPRSSIDSTHVADMAAVIEAGGTLPPIIAEEKTKRIVDGFHRRRAFIRTQGKEAKVAVEWRSYPDERALYLDALRLNSRHGKRISGVDQTRAMINGLNLGLEPLAIAEAFGVKVERVEQIVAIKTGHLKTKRAHPIRIALKNSVRHLRGTDPELTAKQERVIRGAPGQAQKLLVKQLADLIEFDLFDWTDETAVGELRRLSRLLEGRMKKTA